MGGDEGREPRGEGDEGRAGDEGDEDRERRDEGDEGRAGDEGDEDRERRGEGDEGRAGDEGDEDCEPRGEGDEGRAGDEGDEEVSCLGRMTDACASSGGGCLRTVVERGSQRASTSSATDACASSGVWLSPYGRRAWVAESTEIFPTSSTGHGPLVCRLSIVCPPQ